MHITSGHHHIYSQQLTPYLEQVLQGIKKDQLKSSPQRQRLPITAENNATDSLSFGTEQAGL